MSFRPLIKNLLKSAPKVHQSLAASSVPLDKRGYELISHMRATADSFYIMFKVPSQFKPEDLQIRAVGPEIFIEATKTSEDSWTIHTNSITRKFSFGQCFDVGKIQCIYNNGTVEIEGPFKNCGSDSRKEYKISVKKE